MHIASPMVIRSGSNGNQVRFIYHGNGLPFKNETSAMLSNKKPQFYWLIHYNHQITSNDPQHGVWGAGRMVQGAWGLKSKGAGSMEAEKQ